MDHRGVRELAARQHGLATRAQIVALGGSDRHIARQVSSGRWTRAPPGGRSGRGRPCHLGAMGHGRRARRRTWSGREQPHRTAGVGICPAQRSARGAPRRLAGGRRARCGRPPHPRPPARDIAQHEGVPVTSVARTLVDASAGQDARVVASWVDDATRRLGLDLVDLQECLNRRSGPGHPSLAHLRASVDARLPHRSSSTASHCPTARSPCSTWPTRRSRWRSSSTGGSRTGPLDRDRARANQLLLLGWRLYRFTATMSDALLVTTVRRALA